VHAFDRPAARGGGTGRARFIRLLLFATCCMTHV
jgi:hypothetical protein